MGRITEEQLKIRDPLGEIARAARELYLSAGKPEGKNYLDFVEEAEELLLAGKSGGEKSHRERIERREVELPLELRAILRDETRVLDSILISTFQRKLNEHEGFCLFKLLQMKTLKLRDGQMIKRLTPGELGTTLSRVAEPLSAGPEKLSPEERWRIFLEEKERLDEPLNFHDRNTMQLLENRMNLDARVSGFAEE